jgi:hypothetical protein
MPFGLIGRAANQRLLEHEVEIERIQHPACLLYDLRPDAVPRQYRNQLAHLRSRFFILLAPP